MGYNRPMTSEPGKERDTKEAVSRSSGPAPGRRSYTDSWRGYRSDMERQGWNQCQPRTLPAKRQGSGQLKRLGWNAPLGFLPIVDRTS